MSNTTGIIGGLNDHSNMREILEEIHATSPIWAFIPKIHEWKDREGKIRLGWGHPCFVRFQYEEGLEDVMVQFFHKVDRPDGGGIRAMKIEWSTAELRMPTEGTECRWRN